MDKGVKYVVPLIFSGAWNFYLILNRIAPYDYYNHVITHVMVEAQELLFLKNSS